MKFQRCTNCVMDNSSDNTIVFDENGVCSYCKKAKINGESVYFPNEKGKEKLESIISKIKEDGKGKEFDCLMGISGGLDSSYLAYLGHKYGLRILAIHIDDGFDTEISKENVKKLVDKAGIKLLTIAPDAEQFYALSKAYLKAGVPDIAVPQDNVLFAFLYNCVKKYKIKYFLPGGNYALECILQNGNTYNAMDVVNLKAINKKFGTKPINKLKFISTIKKRFYKYFSGIQTYRLLDLIDYNRDRAFKELKEFCGFEYYGSKHLENVFTAFTQLYWFPKKFGVDKRTSHLSSMIVSGQITRDEALKELEKPLYDEALMKEYIEDVKNKLDISDEEFDSIMAAPTHKHEEFKTEKLMPLLRKLKKGKH